MTDLSPMDDAPAEGSIGRPIAWMAAAGLATVFTAGAIVGVIANLGLWFAIHVLFARTAPMRLGAVSIDLPVLSTLHWPAALLAAIAAVLIFRFRLGLIKVLGLMMVLGLALDLAGLGNV